MKKNILSLAMAACLLPLPLASVSADAPQCGRLVEAGVFMVDYSGSMSRTVGEENRTVISLALELADAIAAGVPQEAELRAGVASIAPCALLVPPEVRTSDDFKAKVNELPERMEIFGRRTNLGEGLHDYAAKIKALKASDDGKDHETAEALAHASLIIMTDGDKVNRGRSLEEAAGAFKGALPGVKPVLVSFARSDEEKALARNTAELLGAPLYDGAELLASKDARVAFVDRELFHPCAAESFDFDFSADTLFAFDRAELKPEGVKEIREAAEKLKANEAWLKANNAQFAISAHTDRIGTDAYNQVLSQRRLNTVLKALEAEGVDMTRFTKRTAEGESRPVTGDKCRGGDRDALIACLQPDRRVEIRLIR